MKVFDSVATVMTSVYLKTTQTNFNKQIIQFLSFTLVSAFWYRAFWARTNFESFDWIKENFYFQTLRESLLSGQGIPSRFGTIPAEISYFPAVNAGISYLGNPETLVFSPFLPLAVLGVSDFYKLYLALHLIVAILGIILVGNKLKWSSLTTGLLFVGFVLSPWLMQHVVLGYSPWVLYCWLPLAIYFALDHKLWVSGLLLSFILWGGGFHVYFWIICGLLFVGISAAVIRYRQFFTQIILIILWSILFSSLRIYWVITSLNPVLSKREIAGSYSSITDIYGILADNHTNPFNNPNLYDTYGTAFYDSSFYIGWYGILLIAVSVVGGFFILPKRIWSVCVAAASFFGLLGFDGVWKHLNTALPLLGASEVYPFRFLVISLFFIFVLVLLLVEKLTIKYKSKDFYLFLAFSFLPLVLGFYQRNSFVLLEVLPIR